jgi:hypothetical protein
MVSRVISLVSAVAITGALAVGPLAATAAAKSPRHRAARAISTSCVVIPLGSTGLQITLCA